LQIYKIPFGRKGMKNQISSEHEYAEKLLKAEERIGKIGEDLGV
jgi:hypothetical protein